MNHDEYSDTYIRGILNTVKTIAMVGISPKDNRPSYFAFKYLQERGYRMIPVNPGQAGKEILGQKVYAKLADIPEPIDMVDIFRASQFAPALVDEALALKPNVIGTACPFCMTMMTDGVKAHLNDGVGQAKEPADSVQVKDIAELVLEAVES